MKKLLISLLAFSAIFCFSASAQKFTVSTNVADLLTLGTLNVEGSVAVDQHVSIHALAKANPWTYNYDKENQAQARQLTYEAGVRYWPWNYYSGWWAGSYLRYSDYNHGGVFKQKTEEGTLWGASLWGGYTVMINKSFNFDLGAGLWGGYKKYTVYACPKCGRILDDGEKVFFIPDVLVGVQYVF